MKEFQTEVNFDGRTQAEIDAERLTPAPRSPQLTDRDHRNMNVFLGHVLDDYKNGVISKDQATSGIAQAVAALDKGNYPEVVNWFEQGRTLIRNPL